MEKVFNVEIIITNIACEDFPVWLSFALTDRHGNRHVFEEKAPVILSEDAPTPEKFPIITRLKCELIETFKDYVVISTAEPYSIASIEGKNRFEISSKYVHGVEKI